MDWPCLAVGVGSLWRSPHAVALPPLPKALSGLGEPSDELRVLRPTAGRTSSARMTEAEPYAAAWRAAPPSSAGSVAAWPSWPCRGYPPLASTCRSYFPRDDVSRHRRWLHTRLEVPKMRKEVLRLLGRPPRGPMRPLRVGQLRGRLDVLLAEVAERHRLLTPLAILRRPVLV
jgi:hypothetical protein